MNTLEYTYTPVIILPSGEVIPSVHGYVLGVYSDKTLHAIYTNDPKSRERKTEQTLTLIAGVLGFFGLLALAAVAAPAVTIGAIFLYLAVSMFLLYTVVYDPRPEAAQLHELSEKVVEYYDARVDICPSVTYLTTNYPEGRKDARHTRRNS